MTADLTLTLTRFFACPPETLYDAWTDPKVLPTWFGPEGISCITQDIDIREGGAWTFTMVGHGQTWANRHRYTRLERPHRIEFLMDSGDGTPLHEVTVTITPEDNGARLTQVMLMPDMETKQAAINFGAVELGMTTLGKLAKAVGVA